MPVAGSTFLLPPLQSIVLLTWAGGGKGKAAFGGGHFRRCLQERLEGSSVRSARLLLNLPLRRRPAASIFDTFPNQYPTRLDVSHPEKLLPAAGIEEILIRPSTQSATKPLDAKSVA